VSDSATIADEFVDLAYALDARSVSFDLDETLYPLDAIYGTAYLFVDRCFLFLSRQAPGIVRVRLKAREATTASKLEELAGEFGNELLNQVMRQRVGESTAKIREYSMARAFFSGRATTTIDDLLAELDREELEEAPLDIPVPWMKEASPVPDAVKEPGE
jgi:His-Xaa-Ser system protein HxsD